MRKLLVIGAVLMATLPLSAAVFVRGGYFGGPAYGMYSPYWGPYGYGPYVTARPTMGKVKLDTKVKDAEVFINGSFAGTVGKLKSMWLREGTYNIEVRAAGRTPFAEKVYVVPGKTLHLHPDLRVTS